MKIDTLYKTYKLHFVANLFLISLIFLTPLPNIGTDIYTPSLPSIRESLGTSIALIKLSVSIYIITYGVGQLIFGIISDIIGRRLLLLSGLLGFAVFSFIAILFATNIYILLAARFFQGLSASIISVLSKSIITDKFKGQKLKEVSTYRVSAQVLSIIIAPIIGAYIQVYCGWQWTFVLLAVYGMLSFFTALFFIPETCNNKATWDFLRIKSTLIKICISKSFMLFTLNTGVLYSIIGIFGVMGPFIIQDTLQHSAMVYGLVAFLYGVCYLLGSKISLKVNDKYLIRICWSLFICPSLLLVIFCRFYNLNSLILLGPVLFIAAGCGLMLPKIVALTLNMFRDDAGTASAVFGSTVMIIMGLILSTSSILRADSPITLASFFLVLSVINITLTILGSRFYTE